MIYMESKIIRLFASWDRFLPKLMHASQRTLAHLSDLGIPAEDVRIIVFLSSEEYGELRYFDSEGGRHAIREYIDVAEESAAEERLSELFGICRSNSVFSFDLHSIQRTAYDEFGIIHQDSGEVIASGAVIECPHLASSGIVFELLTQFAGYFKSILDIENYEFREYALTNLVYASLKKTINVDVFNTLAASQYERRVAFGGILLVGEGMQYDLMMRFKEKYPLETKNVRQIRKLLEMTTDKLRLIVLDGQVVGLGACEGCELFQFNGHQKWSYYAGGRELLTYKEGKYTLILSGKENFYPDFPEGFIKPGDAGHLNSILHEIRQQKHGTLLIISDEAETEVNRLSMLGRGYEIDPIDLKESENRKLLASITSIDGALFTDTSFVCYGVGVILDGIAIKPGLSYRGSRYNSAKCYIDGKEGGKYVSVVISEDETIDIIRTLSPSP